MRASANTLAEERSMMNAILSGNDTSFSTGLGIQSITRIDRTHGIPRCSHCRGYVNCFCTFLANTTRFRCNLCGEESDLPDWFRGYVPSLAGSAPTTPELQGGSFEAVVDAAQFNMHPLPSDTFVFVIDCSVVAVNSGLLRAACDAVRAVAALLAEKHNGSRVGFVMCDVRCRYIGCVKGRLTEKIDADYESAFACVQPDAWLLSVDETTLPDINHIVDYILAHASSSTTSTHAILPAALKAVASILQPCGGHVIAVQGSYAIGEGSSQVREGVRTYGTTEESSLYSLNVTTGFYETLAAMCLRSNTTIHLIAGGSTDAFFSICNLQEVLLQSGGSLRYTTALSSVFKEHALADLHAAIQLLVLRPIARYVSGKLRLSPGLSVAAYHGGITYDESRAFCTAGMTSEDSVVAEVEMDRYITGPYAYAQFARPLFTFYNETNECCLRVFNHRFPVSTDYRTIYHNLDFSAYFLTLVRAVVSHMSEDTVYNIRNKLSEVVANVLAAYRNNVCYSSPKSQLNLPESLSLLPLFLNSLLKTPLLAMSPMNTSANLQSIYPRGDLRAYWKWLCYTQSAERVLNAVYPRLYRLDEAKSDWGEEIEGHLVMPDRLPCSGAALTHDGVFLLACDEALFVVVGKTVTAELCGRLFGVATVVNSVHGASLSLLQSEDLLVQRVWRVVERVKEELGEELQVRIVVRGEKEMNEVSLLLRDDRIRLDGSLSEFVCEFFKRVLAKYKWCVC
ncbi:hypothetical protein WA577_000734 [Blastocystis sp. JDR]